MDFDNEELFSFTFLYWNFVVGWRYNLLIKYHGLTFFKKERKK